MELLSLDKLATVNHALRVTENSLNSASPKYLAFISSPLATSITYIALPLIMYTQIQRNPINRLNSSPTPLSIVKSASDLSEVSATTAFISTPKHSSSSSLPASFHELRNWWSKEALTNWKEYLELGIPGAITSFSEFGAYEMCCFFSGYLGEAYLNQNAYMLTLIHVLFMFPYGLSVAASNRKEVGG